MEQFQWTLFGLLFSCVLIMKGYANTNESSSCLNDAKILQELIKGRDGRDGVTGRDGLAGPPGVPGRDGRDGENGLPGAVGEKGNPGVVGPPGAPGPQGPTGVHGASGVKGQKGEVGLQGAHGSDGHDGVKGERGAAGPPGVQGPKGAHGSDGHDGVKGERGATGQQGTQGPQGTPGSHGHDGVKGERGATGQQGARGPQGAPGSDGLKGAQGPQGVRGPPGSQGLTGRSGSRGPPGPRGEPSPISGGAVYTRWGRTSCPTTSGTSRVYSGRAGRTYLSQGGGGNYQCLPDTPEYSSYIPGVQGDSYMYGVEYQTQSGGPLRNLLNHNVPCAVCHVSTRIAKLMIPAKLNCPTGWTREYYGYLMSTRRTEGTSPFECVDRFSDSIPGSSANTNGGVFYHVEASCNGMACPPYVAEKELTCVVCTK